MQEGVPRLFVVEDETAWQELAIEVAREVGFYPVGPISSLAELREKISELALGRGDAALVDGSFFLRPPDEEYPNGIWAGGLGREAAELLSTAYPALSVIAWSNGTPDWAPRGRRVTKSFKQDETRADLAHILREISGGAA